MTYADVIAIRLNQLCKERGISRNKLATQSGITQSTLEYLMLGKTKNVTLKTLHMVAKGLDMTVSELLDFPELDTTLCDNEDQYNSYTHESLSHILFL